MKAKTKLIATLMAMCLVITLGVFGILAVKTLNMSVGGNITFSADGLSLEVFAGQFKTVAGGDYSDITTQTGKLQGFVMNTDTKQSDIQSKIDSWKGLELVMNSKGDAVLHFSVKNNMTTPLYVYIETDLGTNTNDNMNMVVDPNGTQIAAGATTEFTVKFDILDTNINAGLTGFTIDVDFEKEERVLKTQNKVDSTTGLETNEVDYYYVEMGTYNGEPVRWRYVADSNGNAYDGTSAVNSLSGYYVLETMILNGRAFLSADKYSVDTYTHNTAGHTSIRICDYGLSDVRNYLINTGIGGFINDIGVDSNNKIYSQIQKRTIEDLYTNIRVDGNPEAITAQDTQFSLSLTGQYALDVREDALWLMSYKEVEKFFPTLQSRIWEGETNAAAYWTRSPYMANALGVHYVNTNGEIYYSYDYIGYDFLIRPCFKIA